MRPIFPYELNAHSQAILAATIPETERHRYVVQIADVAPHAGGELLVLELQTAAGQQVGRDGHAHTTLEATRAVADGAPGIGQRFCLAPSPSGDGARD